ncbi:dipeptide/oligopeptide/nickel ABC transporter permease/ATP-binding protein [Specibacter sp. NPDC057265]|uniref:dipeptide/oligopeptide/nickel ABC transporter permease/ATP-binding protein n=1 Tax=Specibacter sp. NPDC057265 TaxID=3346075 RepID=UPI00362AC5CE
MSATADIPGALLPGPEIPNIPGKSEEARRQGIWRRIAGSPMAAISLGVLVLVVLAVIVAPLLARYDPNAGDISMALLPPGSEHWLGTDSAGRDVFSRIVYGGRITLGGAALALAIAAAIGVTTGLFAGYFGGRLDSSVDWVSNLLIALPNIMVLLAVRAAWGSNVWLSMTVFGVLMAPGFHRLVRAIVSGIRNELYVDAARVSGLTLRRILGRHVLVAVRAPIIIYAALTGVVVIGVQAGLDFLGLGDVTVPSWGTMLNEALVNLYIAPGLMLWPGMALGLVNAALILFGNSLRDALEDRPGVKTRKRRRSSAKATADVVPAMDPIGAASKDPGTSRDTKGSIPADGIPADSVLLVRRLQVGYPSENGYKAVVKGISFGVRRGEVLGLVGESGSGKTQTAWSILGLLPAGGRVLDGEVEIGGRVVSDLSKKDRRALLGKSVAYIPQEPMSNLDPAFRIGFQLVEPIRRQLGINKAQATAKALAMLARVGITDPQRTFDSYPHQISGGMAQRVLIAGAVACDPDVLIADEPTTALDVTVQAEVLDLLRELQQEKGMAVVLVTHNFGVVADLCDRVAVMKLGEIVEQNGVEELFAAPKDPYTRMLLGSGLEGKTPRTRLLPAEAVTLEEASL